jgi:Lon protease-like protein
MIIPIFPLQLIAFPGEEIPLHIFEPRYRRLMYECEHDGIAFAIFPVQEKTLFASGTLMQLVKVDHRYEDGTLDVLTLGMSPVRLVELQASEDPNIYHSAVVERLPYEVEGDEEARDRILALYEDLHQRLQTETLKPIDPERPLSYQIAHYCGMQFAEQAALLDVRTEDERLRRMEEHLLRVLNTLAAVDDSVKLIRQNGHHKHLTGADFEL